MSRMETERAVSSFATKPSFSTAAQVPDALSKEGALDRTKKCPMLVRIFCRNGGHHRLNEFTATTCTSNSGLPIDDELTIYTWPDATLKELTNLIKDVEPNARASNVSFHFKLVYLNSNAMAGGDYGRSAPSLYNMRDVGIVRNNQSSPSDSMTLKEARFIQGDFLDVALFIGSGNAASRKPNNANSNW